MSVKQARIVDAEFDRSQAVQPVAFFDMDGNPVDLAGGGGQPAPVAWADITGKPTIPAAATVDNLGGAGAVGKTVMKAADAAAARTAIGAGTSNLKVGTAATDAKAGNYKPTLAEIGAASQADLTALVARVAALEAAE